MIIMIIDDEDDDADDVDDGKDLSDAIGVLGGGWFSLPLLTGQRRSATISSHYFVLGTISLSNHYLILAALAALCIPTLSCLSVNH